MAFVKGTSGNPLGRKPKTDTEKALRERIRSAAPAVIDALIAGARAGDVPAAKVLMSFILPPWRAQDRPVSIDLGPDISSAMTALRTAIAGGELTPGAAAAVASIIGIQARIQETAELEKRLIALENQLAQPND